MIHVFIVAKGQLHWRGALAFQLEKDRKEMVQVPLRVPYLGSPPEHPGEGRTVISFRKL